MAPNQGLVHQKEYDWRDSNVELVGSDLDHKVKYASAASEPAWNDGSVGVQPGLKVWRIEDFEVKPVPKEKYGQFYDGDSYIVLHSYKVGKDTEPEKLGHEIFFWLGAHTSQDEAGTAAYKTVELDEFLAGKATQHRELQQSPSDDFVALFPRLQIRSGGVASGFRHVEEEEKKEVTTLLRVFKHGSSTVVHEVDPVASSLDEDDVFVLDKGDKIWVWQGKGCSPMEKMKAAQVVHDMTLAKHVDVEVLAQAESRSSVFVKLLSGDGESGSTTDFHHSRPLGPKSKSKQAAAADRGRPRRLLRLSDESGQLRLDVVRDAGQQISQSDLDGNDVFLLDDAGRAIWVWEGQGASRAEKATWMRVAQQYVRSLLEQHGGGYDDDDDEAPYLTPIAKVRQGDESPAFIRALQVH